MKRRVLLAGLALASVEARAQTQATGAAAESLYIPKPQLVADRRFLHDFMDEFSFVDLVTVSPSACVSLIFRFGWTEAPARMERSTATSRARTRRAVHSTASRRESLFSAARTGTSRQHGTPRAKPLCRT